MDMEIVDALRQVLRNEIQEALQPVNNRLDGIDSRLNAIEKGQVSLQSGQADLQRVQADLQNGQADLQNGQADLQNGQADLQRVQADLQSGQADLRSGLADLQRVQAEQAEFERGTRALLEATNKNVKLLAEGYSAHTAKLQQLDRIEATLNDVKSDTEILKDVVSWHSKDISELKQA